MNRRAGVIACVTLLAAGATVVVAANAAQAATIDPNGYYVLVARHSQKCMDVEGDKTQGYAYIWQYTCDFGDNQQFRFI